MFNTIRKIAFFPAFLMMIAILGYNLLDKEGFGNFANALNNWVMANLGWSFSVAAVVCLAAVIVTYFSPLAKVRIGGPDAKPLFKKKEWFSITLCTTLAAGLLFWGTAEPIYHITAPPESLGIAANSPEAAKFAMETMFLHWTFVPYAFYTVSTIIMAFAFYNMKKPFSVGSQLAPILGKNESKTALEVIDAIVLLGLALVFASSMATGIINMGGAVNAITGIASGPASWGIITIIAIATFVISSSTGLLKGIRVLSNINVIVYAVILGFVFLVGPTVYNLNIGVEGFGGFINGLFNKTLFTGGFAGDPWPSWWTTFYWANWMGWGPVTAVFLGRLCKGYTIKEVIQMNFLWAGFFGSIWMVIFAGTAINFQMTGVVDLASVLYDKGPEFVGYAVLQQFPLSGLIIPFFLFITLITFITAADSTTNAIAGICTTGVNIDNQEGSLLMKVIWGVGMGAVAYILLSFAGIGGIKTLSNAGGVPAIIIVIGAAVSLFVLNRDYTKLDLVSGTGEKVNINTVSTPGTTAAKTEKA